MMKDKEKMHPEDMRNLIIFAILSIIMWVGYDYFVLQPQKLAMQQAKKVRTEMMLAQPEVFEPVKLVDRGEALKTVERLTFGNDEIKGTITLKGARIDDLQLKNYFETLEKKVNVSILSPDKAKYARYIDAGWVAENKEIALPGPTSIWQVQGNENLTPDTPVILVWDNGQGLRFERTFSIDNQYLLKIRQRVINSGAQDIVLHPYALISQVGLPEGYQGRWIMHEGPMGFIGGELTEISYKNIVKEPRTTVKGETGWTGVSDKYWLTALIPAQGRETTYRYRYTPDVADKERGRYQTDFTGTPSTLSPGQAIENQFYIYAGAKKVLVLEDYQRELGIPKLDLAVDFGWFWFFTRPFFLALHYLGAAVGNMGVAIIILTVLIRTAVFPLTNISYRSFAKMKVVAPQIHELRARLGDDKEKLQQGIMELYQKEGVNPMSGCLPIFIQIPIFFAFYKILFMTIEIRHAPFFGWIKDLSAKDPTSVFNLFGLLPYEVPAFLGIGVWPCLMLVVMLVQKRLNPPPQDKLQRDMMNYFPFIITFVMAGFASGLVIYWTFSALISVIQQTIIMRSLGVPVYLFEKDKFEEELEKDLEKGPDVHPLIEMAEDQVEDALFGDDGTQSADIKPPKPKKKKKKK